MTVRVLAQQSGVTTAESHRLGLGPFMTPGTGALQYTSGIHHAPGVCNLTSSSAMAADVSAFTAVVDGTSNPLQGAYPVVVDAPVTINFDDGEGGVVRTDRVILQVRDDPYDASGFQDAQVIYLKGQPSGSATALPNSALLLWEVNVPAGASAGGGGINFASARVDTRTWIATPLRIPVNSATQRDALPAIPGLEVTRLDTGDVEQFWSGSWRSQFWSGAWTPYTCSWTAQFTNPTLGNGSISAAYQKLGRTVHVRIYLVRGTTTTIGDGAYSFSLPATAVATRQVLPAVFEIGFASTRYTAAGYLSGDVVLRIVPDGSTSSGLGSAGWNAITWTQENWLTLSGTYESTS